MTQWKPVFEDVATTDVDGVTAAAATITAAGIPATATMVATTTLVATATATTTRVTTVHDRFINVLMDIHRCTTATGAATKQLERQASPAGRL
jgi:siroheme synthase